MGRCRALRQPRRRSAATPALGAPPQLEACTQALADETAHTKLCFSIASAYAGRAIGPGPLDVSDSLGATSLVDIVDLVIAEGCFGETSAALEALEAADTASDPVIVAAYSRIALAVTEVVRPCLDALLETRLAA